MSKFNIGDEVVIKDTGIQGTVEGVIQHDLSYQIKSRGGNNYTIDESSLREKDLLDEPIGEYVEPIMSEDDYLAEMATIAATNKLNVSINPERKRLSIPYFKVYDNGNLDVAKGVARLHFKDSGIEIHNHDPLNKKPWIPNNKIIKEIRNLVSQSDPGHDNIYTIWQVLCYEWNRVNGLIPWNATMKEYTSGKYDNQNFNDTRLQNAYVPSTTKIPDTWEYKN